VKKNALFTLDFRFCFPQMIADFKTEATQHFTCARMGLLKISLQSQIFLRCFWENLYL